MKTETKTKRISMRTSAQIFDHVQRSAKREKQSVSAYIEDCISAPSIHNREQKKLLSETLIRLMCLTQKDYNSVPQMREEIQKEVQDLCQKLS